MKEELTGKHRQVISNQKKKEELQEGDLLKARGRGAFEVAES